MKQDQILHTKWIFNNFFFQFQVLSYFSNQCLLNLLDSPLNKAGLLQIFIRTAKNVLIEVNPKCRIPRTFKRFSGLMGRILIFTTSYNTHRLIFILYFYNFLVQLLHQMTIKANDGSRETLLRLIKNPVTDHLPVGIRIVGTSVQAEKLVNVNEWAASLPPDQSIAVVIGGIAVGNIDVDYTSEEVAISSYPLSAAGVCAKFCSAFEQHWGVL